MSSIFPTSFGGSFDLQDFYRPFRLDEITPENMQLWPYYKRVSAHWPDYVQTSSAPIRAARSPVTVEQGESFDLNREFRGGKTYLQSLLETQVKGFVVLRRSEILAEFYDNGFNLGDTNLLQSASKTFAGVVTHTLIDAGLLDVEAEVGSILAGFEGTTIGDATVQHVLDMTSGAATARLPHGWKPRSAVGGRDRLAGRNSHGPLPRHQSGSEGSRARRCVELQRYEHRHVGAVGRACQPQALCRVDQRVVR